MSHASRRVFLRGGLVVAGMSLLSACGLERLSSSRPMQQRRLAYLSNPVPSDPGTSVFMEAFRESMRDRGYAEGQNLVTEEAYAGGSEQSREFAAIIDRFQPEVIVVPAATVARAVRSITTTIPIVSVGQGDLVTNGLAETLARPGTNVTGLSSPLLAGKPLQLLQETVPGLRRVSLLSDANIGILSGRPPYETAAANLGLELQFLAVSGLGELDAAMESTVHERAGALYVLSGPLFGTGSSQARIIELANQSGLPSMWQIADATTHGALMGYGPNRADLFRRSTVYVDKILRGANPADLPIEQPTAFDLSVNLKTAQALGLTVPASVLAQATEIVE